MVCFKCANRMSNAASMYQYAVCFDCMQKFNLSGFGPVERRAAGRRQEDRRRAERRCDSGPAPQLQPGQPERRQVSHPAWMTSLRAASMAAEIEALCAETLGRMGKDPHVDGFYEFDTDSARKQISIVFKSEERSLVVKTSKSNLRDRLYVKSCESLAAELLRSVDR